VRSPAHLPVALAACAVITLTACATLASAANIIAPNAHLVAENIPPIPAALAVKVAPYTEFKPVLAVSWHPVERELVVARRAVNTTQLHRVASPGSELVPITDFAEPVRFGVFWPKAPDVLVFTRDSGGNEQRQVYRQDPGGAPPVLLTDAARKNDFAGMTRARDRMLAATDTKHAPWYIVRSDDKRRARLNIITHILRLIPHKEMRREKIKLPKRSMKGAYDDQKSLKGRAFVPENY